MKINILFTAIVFVFAGMIHAEEPIHIPDTILKKEVVRRLHFQNPTPEQMKRLTFLKILDGVRDLEGLQYAKNLEWIRVYKGAEVEDYSPLTQLPKLKKLSGGGSLLKDPAVLSSLIHLEELTLNGTELSDLSILSPLTNLTRLDLTGNKITDLTPLQSLNKLTHLDVDRNNISDITPLKSMKNLKSVNLAGNRITEPSSLPAALGLDSGRTRLNTKENPVEKKHLAIRLVVVVVPVVFAVCICVGRDWKKYRKTFPLPNLSFICSLAGPIVYLSGQYLCQSVRTGTHVQKWQYWNGMVVLTWTLVVFGIAMAGFTLVKKGDGGKRVGKIRSWTAIAVGVLFACTLLIANAINDIAGKMMI